MPVSVRLTYYSRSMLLPEKAVGSAALATGRGRACCTAPALRGHVLGIPGSQGSGSSCMCCLQHHLVCVPAYLGGGGHLVAIEAAAVPEGAAA